MKYTQRLDKLLVCVFSAVTLIIVGCANELPNSNSDVHPKSSDINQAANSTKNVIENPISIPETIDYNTVNPLLLDFDKLSVELTSENKQILSQVVDRAKKSRRLTLTGYCDRRQVGNAQAAAIKRATNVKEQLIALGITTPIRIKYITQDTDKHVVEIQF